MHTPAQHTPLDYHLRRVNRLTNEELIQELTDHYTIALSERMAQGMPFKNALADVEQSFGGQRGLQKMERDYNRIMFRKYDNLWIQSILEQIRWPRSLLLLCLAGINWAMQDTNDLPSPSMVVTNFFFANSWSGVGLAAIMYLIVTIGQLVIQKKNFSYKATYVSNRVLPIAILLYGLCGLLTYIGSYFSPFAYKVITIVCLICTFTFLISYSRFYNDVIKKSLEVR